MKRIFQFLVVICVFQISAPVFAQSPQDEITDAQVRKFSAEVIEAYKKPLKEYEALIKSSYTNDATFEFETADKAVNKNKEIIKKQDYTKKLKTYHTALQGGKVTYKVLNVKIAEDKKSAVLKDKINFQKEIKAPSANGKALKVESVSNCEKVVVLSKDNQLQIKSTKCKSKTQAAKSKKNKF